MTISQNCTAIVTKNSTFVYTKSIRIRRIKQEKFTLGCEASVIGTTIRLLSVWNMIQRCLYDDAIVTCWTKANPNFINGSTYLCTTESMEKIFGVRQDHQIICSKLHNKVGSCSSSHFFYWLCLCFLYAIKVFMRVKLHL